MYFVCKVVQIKILYDNKCARNVHQITAYVQTVQNLYKVQTKNSLKLEMYLFCKFNWNGLCMFFVPTYNIQTVQNVYKC